MPTLVHRNSLTNICLPVFFHRHIFACGLFFIEKYMLAFFFSSTNICLPAFRTFFIKTRMFLPGRHSDPRSLCGAVVGAQSPDLGATNQGEQEQEQEEQQQHEEEEEEEEGEEGERHK